MHGTNSVNHNETPQNCLKIITILLVSWIDLFSYKLVATQITELIDDENAYNFLKISTVKHQQNSQSFYQHKSCHKQ